MVRRNVLANRMFLSVAVISKSLEKKSQEAGCISYRANIQDPSRGQGTARLFIQRLFYEKTNLDQQTSTCQPYEHPLLPFSPSYFFMQGMTLHNRLKKEDPGTQNSGHPRTLPFSYPQGSSRLPGSGTNYSSRTPSVSPGRIYLDSPFPLSPAPLVSPIPIFKTTGFATPGTPDRDSVPPATRPPQKREILLEAGI